VTFLWKLAIRGTPENRRISSSLRCTCLRLAGLVPIPIGFFAVLSSNIELAFFSFFLQQAALFLISF
jgi:hypothetical protein